MLSLFLALNNRFVAIWRLELVLTTNPALHDQAFGVQQTAANGRYVLRTREPGKSVSGFFISGFCVSVFSRSCLLRLEFVLSTTRVFPDPASGAR